MFFCDGHFGVFNERIKLDATRRGRIDSAVANFIAYCENDIELHKVMAEKPFLQGSVATGTVIKPLLGDEFDVDVIYPFNLNNFNNPSPTGIVDWFVGRLQLSADYKQRLIIKPRCARLNYAGDFHVDIIPSAKDKGDMQPYAVPTRDKVGWKKNDPKGFSAWVQNKDVASQWIDGAGDGRFKRACRFLKRWRDHRFGDESAPSSMLLITVLGKHAPPGWNYFPQVENLLYPEHQCDAAYLYDLVRITIGCIETQGHEGYMNPTIPEENLAAGWEGTHSVLFVSRLRSLADGLWKAMNAITEAEATQLYQAALGNSFPT
jgi:hypothetical protein